MSHDILLVTHVSRTKLTRTVPHLPRRWNKVSCAAGRVRPDGELESLVTHDMLFVKYVLHRFWWQLCITFFD